MTKAEYFYWNNVKFINKRSISLINDILKAKLITVPSAPALVENCNNQFYYNALRESDFAIIDSSLFAILCRMKLIKIFKYSGFRLIQDILNYLKENSLKVFLVNSSSESATIQNRYLCNNTNLSSKDIRSYAAPFYSKDTPIVDNNLLAAINIFSPRLIIIGIAGGKQEILASFLNKNLNINTTIVCTGAALSFFTKEQANINTFIDRFYLGWFSRILSNPKIFLPRYMNALKFIKYFFKNRIEVIQNNRRV